jgi:diguanylate cyclase (GGDEF)-like protein/PAS domain S-box-containing protein
MPSAALPRDEDLRLAALNHLGLLDIGQDDALERLCATVAEVLDVPVCVTTVLDRDTLWFKGRHGTRHTHWPREQSLCAHVVASGRPILAHDLRLDDRFADLDVVTQRVPPLRFYAAMPLSFDGHVVGTFAVLDQRPRHDFDERKLALLARFAELAHDQLQQRREGQVGHQERTLFADGPVGAVVWDAGTPPRLSYLSANLDALLGEVLARELRSGRPFETIVHPDDQEYFRTGLSSHQVGDLPELEISYRLQKTGRHARWINQVTQADRDDQGRLRRIRGYLFDLTRQKQLEASIESTKERLYLALESARIGTWDLNLATQERLLNTRAAAMLGYREDELEHSQLVWMDMIHPHDRMAIERSSERYRDRDKDVVMVEYRIRHKRGHHIWVRSHGRVVEHDRRGEPRRVVGTLIDITEDKQKEALRNRQRQLLDLLNQAQTSFLLNRSVQEACEALFEPLLRISDCHFGFIGIVQRDTQGRPYLRIPTLSDSEWRDTLTDPLVDNHRREAAVLRALDSCFGQAVTTNEVVLINHPVRHPLAAELPEHRAELRNFLGLPIRFDHQVVGMIGLGNRAEDFDEQLVQLLEPLVVTLGTLFHARDQETAREAAEAELMRLASRDTLTGLANRRQFFDLADAALAQTRRYGSPLTVALMDLDHFKQINDTHGHAAGDAVLTAFAEVLRESLRDSDTAARIGGEEFAVLLSNTPQDEALHALERVRASLEQRLIEAGASAIRATVSIGAVQWRPEHHGIDAMLAQADEALYAAKRLGRNRVHVHRHDLDPGSTPPSARAANDSA